jgi:hypothetical protein
LLHQSKSIFFFAQPPRLIKHQPTFTTANQIASPPAKLLANPLNHQPNFTGYQPISSAISRFALPSPLSSAISQFHEHKSQPSRSTITNAILHQLSANFISHQFFLGQSLQPSTNSLNHQPISSASNRFAISQFHQPAVN